MSYFSPSPWEQEQKDKKMIKWSLFILFILLITFLIWYKWDSYCYDADIQIDFDREVLKK